VIFRLVFLKLRTDTKNFVVSNFISRKSCRLLGNVGKYDRAIEGRDDKMAHALCMPDN
jgi:hypothetical protein